jgi:hypothetical protein
VGPPTGGIADTTGTVVAAEIPFRYQVLERTTGLVVQRTLSSLESIEDKTITLLYFIGGRGVLYAAEFQATQASVVRRL